jgi:membrane protease YdiL (CAAX protease family)
MDKAKEASPGDEDKPKSLFAPDNPLQPPPQPYISRPFYGTAGVHALWRLLFFIALWRAFYFLVGIIIFLLSRSVRPLWLQLIAEGGMAASAVIPTLILAGFEQRPFGSYGLPGRQAFGKFFWAGILWGFGALTMLMLTLHAAGGFDLGRFNLHGLGILKFAAFWGIFFLLVGFYEEVLTRGYAQMILAASFGFWPAAFILSAGFAALHLANPGENLVGLAAVFLIALFFCLTLRRTGTLWFAVGFHASWDWGESFFYSVPDSGLTTQGHLFNSSLHGPAWLSGGTVGPEGSVFAFAVVLLTGAAFACVYRAVRPPNSEESSLAMSSEARPDSTPPQFPYQE